MSGAEFAVVADGPTRRFGLVYTVRDLSLSIPPSSILPVMRTERVREDDLVSPMLGEAWTGEI